MAKIKIVTHDGMQMEATAPSATESLTLETPKELGGSGAHMSPTDGMAVSLAACMVVMMRMKAKQLGIDLGDPEVEVSKSMQMAPVLKFTGFTIHFRISCNPEQKEQLEEAAKHCPIHTALKPEIKVNTTFEWQE